MIHPITPTSASPDLTAYIQPIRNLKRMSLAAHLVNMNAGERLVIHPSALRLDYRYIAFVRHEYIIQCSSIDSRGVPAVDVMEDHDRLALVIRQTIARAAFTAELVFYRKKRAPNIMPRGKQKKDARKKKGLAHSNSEYI